MSSYIYNKSIQNNNYDKLYHFGHAFWYRLWWHQSRIFHAKDGLRDKSLRKIKITGLGGTQHIENDYGRLEK